MNFNQMNINQSDGVSSILLFFILSFVSIVFVLTQGYLEHLISTISEWLFTLIIMLLMLTFVVDFRKIKIQHPVVIQHENLEENNRSVNLKDLKI